MPLKLYLNEDIAPDLAKLLRERGFDAISTYEVGMCGKSDEEQMEFACREGRAILSCNFHDFLKLAREWFLAGKEHFGIIISYRQYTRRDLGKLLQAVIEFLNRVSPEEMYNTVRVLDEFVK